MSWEQARREQKLDPAEAISTTGPGSLESLEGIPLAEYARASLQPCIRCGNQARASVEGGILVNMRVVDQVLVAETLCSDCMTDEEHDKYSRVRDAK